MFANSFVCLLACLLVARWWVGPSPSVRSWSWRFWPRAWTSTRRPARRRILERGRAEVLHGARSPRLLRPKSMRLQRMLAKFLCTGSPPLPGCAMLSRAIRRAWWNHCCGLACSISCKIGGFGFTAVATHACLSWRLSTGNVCRWSWASGQGSRMVRM